MSEDEQAYLERYHAAHRTPDPVIGRMVARAAGASPQARRRLTDGSNETYLVTTDSSQEYLLKIALLSETDFGQERWAMDQCRAAGAPVPEVLFVGEEEGRAFMVQAKSPGRPLITVLPTLGEADRAILWPRVGAVLGAIHSVTVEGFWKRQTDGRWDFPDWASVMESTVHDRGAERPLLLRAGFDEEDCGEMMRLLLRYHNEFDCPRPVLCHCDYLPEHILVDDDLHVSGIVDFGDFCGDHPIRDLAIVHEAEEMNLAGIVRGYTGEWLREARFEDRLYLHRLTLDMGYLAHFMRERPERPWIAFHSRQLRATLNWLQSHGW